ncbi:MAG: DUF47 domain-containing protein [Armatimonadetes bacterium]|nr:DUF47 domain-containing protein [Armatimonadota bacterium]
MKLNLLPKEEKFFDYFKKHGEIIHDAVLILKKLLETCTYPADQIQRIEDLEQEGDDIVREVALRLNKTFITPIDREDIHELTSDLDDVLDYVKSAAIRLSLFHVPDNECNLPAQELAGILVRAAEEIKTALKVLSDFKDVTPHTDLIKRLEREGDDVHHKALGDLFSDSRPVLEIIKWKEIYERLETALDRCEDVAQVIESVMLKHA